LAVIDTALNSQLPQFKDKVVFEACVLDWPSCPNGKAFMEGPGSAALPVNLITKNGNDHGVKMVSAALTTNPNLKIVFVRYRGTTLDGTPQITNESSFVNAFKWVWDNRQRFNIQAVAMSQGHGNFAAGQADYCPKTPATQAMLQQFANAGIPVFLPAGNNRDQKRVNWPSCFPEAVTISATSAGDGIAIYSNFDINRTDFFAPGTLNVLQGDGTFKNEAGTSVSVQVAAAIWMHVKSKNPNLTYSEMMAYLNTQGEQIVGRTWKDVKIRVLNKYQFIK